MKILTHLSENHKRQNKQIKKTHKTFGFTAGSALSTESYE